MRVISLSRSARKPVCSTECCVQNCTFGDSIEGKLVTVVDELKGSDCGNVTEDNERVLSLRSQNMLMKLLMI